MGDFLRIIFSGTVVSSKHNSRFGYTYGTIANEEGRYDFNQERF